jgi:hypothetical protein
MAIRHLFFGFSCTRGSLLQSRDFYHFLEAVILLRNVEHYGISSVQESIPRIPSGNWLQQLGVGNDDNGMIIRFRKQNWFRNGQHRGIECILSSFSMFSLYSWSPMDLHSTLRDL